MVIGQSLFPPRRAPFINYDWTNVADATGYIVYDCFKTVDSVGITRSLVQTSSASELYSISVYDGARLQIPHFIDVGPKITGGVFAKSLDMEAFKLPRILKGIAHLRLHANYYEVGAASVNFYTIARLKKNNVEIASTQSTTIINQTTGEIVPLSLNITIPQTHFKKEDKVRLTLEGWTNATGTGGVVAFAGDPQDRTDSYTFQGFTYNFQVNESRIVLTLPYKMEI